MKVRAHIVISGRVQEVFFRASTEREALRLGLSGWVKNIPSGEVEAVFEGNQSQVEEMLTWCRHGPPSAQVTGVKITWENSQGDEQQFQIR